MRNSCQEGDDYAEGFAVGEEDKGDVGRVGNVLILILNGGGNDELGAAGRIYIPGLKQEVEGELWEGCWKEVGLDLLQLYIYSPIYFYCIC